MLDQSFSAANFRKIFDIENRRGNYLEGTFFLEIEKLSQLIQSCMREFRLLRSEKTKTDPVKYEEKKNELSAKYEELKTEKERLLGIELEKISAEVTAKGFSFGIKEIDIGLPKKVFVADNTASTFFSLKQVQHNIRRLYKVKQSNRHQIVCQLRELLGDRFPKHVVRTDISSFYESIPREKLLEKLKDDPLLTLASKKIIRRILFEYGQITGSDIGLPRGIGISTYLAELYMRDIDNTIRDHPGVLYYARYVDDIFIIFCPPPNTTTREFRKTVVGAFRNMGLKRNRKKTQVFKIVTGGTYSIEYLGYKFEIGSGAVVLKMTNKKVTRYKQRVDLSFDAYDKQSKTSEKKARALLERRIRFLTGNTRLVNNKKNVVSGIFFSNSLLNSSNDLKKLDAHLSAKISLLTNARLKNRLSICSFNRGFEKRKYFKFSAHELSQIVEVWKHVS